VRCPNRPWALRVVVRACGESIWLRFACRCRHPTGDGSRHIAVLCTMMTNVIFRHKAHTPSVAGPATFSGTQTHHFSALNTLSCLQQRSQWPHSSSRSLHRTSRVLHCSPQHGQETGGRRGESLHVSTTSTNFLISTTPSRPHKVFLDHAHIDPTGWSSGRSTLGQALGPLLYCRKSVMSRGEPDKEDEAQLSNGPASNAAPAEPLRADPTPQPPQPAAAVPDPQVACSLFR